MNTENDAPIAPPKRGRGRPRKFVDVDPETGEPIETPDGAGEGQGGAGESQGGAGESQGGAGDGNGQAFDAADPSDIGAGYGQPGEDKGADGEPFTAPSGGEAAELLTIITVAVVPAIVSAVGRITSTGYVMDPFDENEISVIRFNAERAAPHIFKGGIDPVGAFLFTVAMVSFGKIRKK